MIVLHEMMHAVGFVHEHERTDRDQYVKINMANVQPGEEHNFTIVPGTQIVRPYCFQSIMHYGPYDFSSNGKPVIEPQSQYTKPFQDGVVGQRTYLDCHEYIDDRFQQMFGARSDAVVWMRYHYGQPPKKQDSALISFGRGAGKYAVILPGKWQGQSWPQSITATLVSQTENLSRVQMFAGYMYLGTWPGSEPYPRFEISTLNPYEKMVAGSLIQGVPTIKDFKLVGDLYGMFIYIHNANDSLRNSFLVLDYA